MPFDPVYGVDEFKKYDGSKQKDLNKPGAVFIE